VNITIDHVDSIEILKLEGIFNSKNISSFKDHFDRIDHGDINHIILDMERVEEIDSTGIGAIISLLKNLQHKGGNLRIIKLRGAVKKLFEVLRIDRIIEVYEDETVALK